MLVAEDLERAFGVGEGGGGAFLLDVSAGIWDINRKGNMRPGK